ncbi:hypothetical protein [Paenibacillus oleatilyticus]|uniref:hypothetical protein n=1 Tax=Paenibacillus oleatilyticus TaxID=2594886 RepID=UPI001C1FD20D|nr:hypothetical protein [Paenibacillus oleatilyticus]MBU7314389.1 hypothetical protein [Paenibacillus oleatilyticus]
MVKRSAAILALCSLMALSALSMDAQAASASQAAPSSSVQLEPPFSNAFPTQWVMVGSPIPEGWVITKVGGNMIEITNVKSATYGREIWVMLGSPIPQGWVIIRPTGNMNLIKFLG